MRNTSLHGARLVTHDRVYRADLHLAAAHFIDRPSDDTAWDLDLTGHLIYPGFVNCHDHLPLNTIPPLPQDGVFPNSYAWARAFQGHFRDSAVAASLAVDRSSRFRHGALKNLLSGTTTVAHHDPLPTDDLERDFPVRLLRDFGWSHSLGLGSSDPVWSDQAPYGPPILTSFAATPTNCPWMVHLAEGTDALSASELTRLESMGCLADNTVLIHGVGLTEAQIQRVIEARAGVIWCPSSNLRLLGQTLDPRRLYDAGRLALGTDSRLTGSRDLLSELRIAAEHSDLTPRELLRLVTAAGSDMIRMADVGGLESGQSADLIVVRDHGDDPYRQLLETSRGDLRAVVRGGVPLIADPDFADWFSAVGIDVIEIKLDNSPKLISSAHSVAIELEPGAALVHSGG
jgi:cytosine/adenosine deaminase-related metal-dependent hydrolase